MFADIPGDLVVKNLPSSAEDVGLTWGWGDSLGKKMAAHPSTLAWEIPWREQRAGLQSMELQKNWIRLSN